MSKERIYAQMCLDLVDPPAEITTFEAYKDYVKQTIRDYNISGAASKSFRKPSSPSAGSIFLKNIADDPLSHIAYDDVDALMPLVPNVNQDGLEEDELRLANGKILVFPGKVSDKPNGVVVVKE